MKYLYELLNLNENARQEEIQKAFRKLAKRYHPDISHDQERFIEILNAYKSLMKYLSLEENRKLKKNSETNRGIWVRTAPGSVLPENRVCFALSLQDIALMGIFNRGKTKRRSGFHNPKGYDVTVFCTNSELRAGASVFIHIPAHVICPLCRGDRISCRLCSDRGYILKAVPVKVHIPVEMQDGDIFSVPLEKKKGSEYAYFMKKQLLIRVSLINEGKL